MSLAMAMTDLEQNIFKLRVCFHKRLADSLGLTVDVKRIEEFTKQLPDDEVFRLIEIESQKKEQSRNNFPFKVIRIAKNSKLLRQITSPSLFIRLKSFLWK